MSKFTSKNGLIVALSNPKFKPYEFIEKCMSSNEIGISNVRANLNQISTEITQEIQDSIFDNYLTFIDAGKAISSLEVNMHQIHNSINELKILISMASEKFHLRTQKINNEIPTKLSEVFEEVVGLSKEEFEPNVKLSTVMDVLEYDCANFKAPAKSIRIYLFENYILTAQKLKTQDMYFSKDKIYAINDTVLNEPSFANKPNFSLLFSHDFTYRLFSFKELLQKIFFLETFRSNLNNIVNRQAKVALPRSNVNVVKVDYLSLDKEELIKSVISSTIPSVANFVGIYSDTNIKIVEKKARDDFQKSEIEMKLAKLKETPEDLDVAIAEREFTRANKILWEAKKTIKQLIEKKDHNNTRETLHQLEVLNKKLEEKSCHLASVLQMKIMQAAERHDSSKSVYQSVGQLILLGRRNFANELFLIYRSGIMSRILTKNVRQEGIQSLYLNRLSLAFHKGIIETYLEWNNIIKTKWNDFFDADVTVEQPDDYAINSSKISQWILKETENYAEQIVGVWSDTRSFSFQSMSSSIERMKSHSKQVEKMLKIRIVPILDKILLKTWQKSLNYQANVIRESIEQRSESEKWICNFDRKKRDWKSELKKKDIESIESFAGIVPLATYRFSRSFLSFYIGVCQLDCLSLQSTLMQNIDSLVTVVGEIFQKALNNPKLLENKEDILMSMDYLMIFIFKSLTDTLYKPIVDLDHYDLIINRFNNIYKSANPKDE